MSEPTKFCKDCRFLRKKLLEPITLACCGHPSAVVFGDRYLVSANAGEHRYCTSMRSSGCLCGPDAKLWEPRR